MLPNAFITALFSLCPWHSLRLSAGLLVELEASGSVLEGTQEWEAEAPAIRARQLRILSLMASRYLSSGQAHQACKPDMSFCSLG